MAAAALAAAADQKDMGWVKTGKIAKKPKLTDPLQPCGSTRRARELRSHASRGHLHVANLGTATSGSSETKSASRPNAGEG